MNCVSVCEFLLLKCICIFGIVVFVRSNGVISALVSLNVETWKNGFSSKWTTALTSQLSNFNINLHFYGK